ncbi:uncharacterized protein CMU_025150 [Cryptosporidium muris RN66]|uniref:Uncharacterized protein n=1 Tax=Cryptosporidium muris (strain RN66) TaxID=441375 RepID=B6AAV7_CRYMR|nr:uncharacterized protein CMU_025150 [Cryptosporidium muris RN66]EEA05509.1 hypothetical protein, conserved [Cryptosporidium muris RN66]|eukprot:XP_002139858.1 hypothetical protein [Cryptosporidium muris RN66]
MKNETIIQAPNPQILACSSYIDVEIVLWQQSKEVEKGLVIFIGKLTADSWRSSRILKIAYENEFTVVAISPPGIGKTTQLTLDIIENSNVSSSSFLNWIIVTCLQKKTTETVIVSQSNSITQLYTIPLIMTYPVAGIIFFNTNMGIKWFTALNPVISDHYYYQPVNFDNTIVRYIGDKTPPVISTSNSTQNEASNSSKLDNSKTIRSLVTSNYKSSNNINRLNSNSHRALQTIQSNEVNYVKGMSNVTKAIFSCVAPGVSYKFNVDWYLTEQDKLGPFGWFDGKYTIPGWQMVQTVYEATDFDVFEGTRVKNGSYVLNISYFKPLAIALSQTLPIIAQIIAFPSNTSNSQTLQSNSTNFSNFTGSDNIAPTTFNDIRQKEYMRYRTKFELIPAQNVYCTT